MQFTLGVAEECLQDNNRAPFSSIIVKDNKIIGIGKESTQCKCDPTAHSEIEALRSACKNLKTTNLEDCILYTSSEPCSMCMSAMYWANVSLIYYACSRNDVYRFGFPDRFDLIEKRIQIEDKPIHQNQILRKEGIKLFLEYERRLLTLDMMP